MFGCGNMACGASCMFGCGNMEPIGVTNISCEGGIFPQGIGGIIEEEGPQPHVFPTPLGGTAGIRGGGTLGPATAAFATFPRHLRLCLFCFRFSAFDLFLTSLFVLIGSSSPPSVQSSIHDFCDSIMKACAMDFASRIPWLGPNIVNIRAGHWSLFLTAARQAVASKITSLWDEVIVP